MNVLERKNAQLLHIYFGQIAVHLLPLIHAWENPSIVSFHGADVMVDMNKPAYREATRQMLDAVKLVLVRSESLRRAVVDLGCDEKKDRRPANGDSTPRISVSRTKLCRRGDRMALCAGVPFDRQKRSARHAPRLREFLETISKRDANHRRRGAIARPTSDLALEAKKEDRSWRFVQRFHFTGAAVRYLLCVAHFPASSETGADGNQEGVPNSMLKQWRVACQFLQLSMAEFPKQSRTA